MKDLGIKLIYCLLYIVVTVLFAFVLTTTLYFKDARAQMAVADAGALVQAKLNYIEAINTVSQLRENLQVVKDTLNVTEEMKQGVGEMRKFMSTVYNNTFGLIGEIARLREDLLKTPGEFDKMMNAFKNAADCLFDDLDKYQQVETIYSARYHFVDSAAGTPNYPDDDPYVWSKTRSQGDQSAGDINELPIQLQENPCGYKTKTFHDELKERAETEKAIIERILAGYNKTEEEAKNLQKFYQEMEKKVEKTETEKETLDTMKAILWKMNSHLENIDRNLSDVTYLYVSAVHDPKRAFKAPRITPEVEAMMSSNGIVPGKSTQFDKAASAWKALRNGSSKTYLK
ncbi:hypothetical protein KKI24_12525 [bacterium]|nr:hypothetical protein [bacterium]